LRADHGTTVFLTTHYLEEADRYAERVMVMDRGRVIADNTAAALKANLAGDLLTFGFANEAEAHRGAGIIGQRTGAPVRRPEPALVQLTAPAGDALLPSLVRALDAAGIAVVRASGVPPTLDDVFLALTGRTLREAGEGEPAEDPETQSETQLSGAPA